jgi:hypothetical protein
MPRSSMMSSETVPRSARYALRVPSTVASASSFRSVCASRYATRYPCRMAARPRGAEDWVQSQRLGPRDIPKILAAPKTKTPDLTFDLEDLAELRRRADRQPPPLAPPYGRTLSLPHIRRSAEPPHEAVRAQPSVCRIEISLPTCQSPRSSLALGWRDSQLDGRSGSLLRQSRVGLSGFVGSHLKQRGA